MEFREKQIVIQKGYNGREVQQTLTWKVLNGYKRLIITEESKFDKSFIEDSLFIGTVEWIESIFEVQPKPDYFPVWLKEFYSPKIYEVSSADIIESYPCFLKPADRYKRFDSYRAYSKQQASKETGPFVVCPLYEGPFLSEWRYYISNGKVVAAEWYKGVDDVETVPPNMEEDVEIPSDYCGAVDFGLPYYDPLNVILIEAHHPYACGWYGYYDNIESYLEWIWQGQKYLRKNKDLYHTQKLIDIIKNSLDAYRKL